MSVEFTYADLEIRILERQEEGYPVEMTLNREQEFPRGVLHPDLLPWVPCASLSQDGERLFEWLLADPRLGAAWAEVRGRHPQRRIRLRTSCSTIPMCVQPALSSCHHLTQHGTAAACRYVLKVDSINSNWNMSNVRGRDLQ